jgi:hypothetical protein
MAAGGGGARAADSGAGAAEKVGDWLRSGDRG